MKMATDDVVRFFIHAWLTYGVFYICMMIIIMIIIIIIIIMHYNQ